VVKVMLHVGKEKNIEIVEEICNFSYLGRDSF